MCCESDGWVIPSRRAARVNDPSSTTATKHSSWRRFIGKTYRCDCSSAHLTYSERRARLPSGASAMRATRINHVSIAAADLEESTRFYEEVFGMERIPTPTFADPVQWLRVGDLQLHLFLDAAHAARPPPRRHHDRRLRRRLPGREGADVRRVRLAARRAALAAGAALLPRPRREPDRAQLARRRHARPRRATRSCSASPITSRRRRRSQGAVLYLENARRERLDRLAETRAGVRPAGPGRAQRRLGAARRRRRRARGLGALPRADDGQLGDVVRLRRARPEGLPDHAPERRHRRRALLRRRERLHADLRPDARRQHGARRVLPLRRLRRAQAPAPLRRRGRLVRPDELAGQPHPLDRARARRHRRSSPRWGSSCSSSSCAGTRARTCGRR